MRREEIEIIINNRFSSLCSSDLKVEDNETIPKIRRRMLDTRDLITRLKSSVVGRSVDELLPQNCRYSRSSSEGYKLLVLEDPPTVRSIHLDIDLSANIEMLRKTGKLELYGYTKEVLNSYSRRPYRITLAFPYIVYVVLVTRNYELYAFKIFYRLHPLTSLSDYLLLPNLLNIDGGSRVCLGEGSSSGRSIIEVCTKTLNRFWNNSFNTDYMASFKSYEDVVEVADFLTWQYYSLKDPMFIFDIKWKAHSNVLKDVLEKVLANKREDMANRISFDSLTDLFTKPVKTIEKRVYVDPCESVALEEGFLSLGDEVDLDGNKYWVSGFKGLVGYPPQAVILENEKGEKVEELLSESFRDTLSKKMTKVNTLPSLEVKNGVTIKPGDIVEVYYPFKTYRKVNEIRIARDSNIEVKMGGDYYLADVLELKHFDEKIKIYGIEMEVGKDYTLISRPTDILLYTGKTVKLSGVDVSDNGSLTVKFSDENSGFIINETFDNLERRWKLINEDDPIHSPVFRFGPQIFTCQNQDYKMLKGVGVLYGGHIDRALRFNYDPDLAETTILKDGGFSLPSFDVDLDFKIGDKVIFCNWRDRMDMLKVREVMGISYDKEKGDVKITAKNGDDVKTVTYANLLDGKSFIGKVRKVALEYNGLVAGMKLKAKVAGISKFPKKDVNEIVAFITDTGTGVPLMLCSNLCTIWAHDDYLSKFNYLLPSSPLWSNYENAPIGNLPMQPGDLVYYRNLSNRWYPYMRFLDKYGRWRHFATYYMARYLSTSSMTYLDDGSIRWGVLQPRFTAKQLGLFSPRYVYPNLHGGYTEIENREGLLMRTDWRCACSKSS